MRITEFISLRWIFKYSSSISAVISHYY